MRFMLKNMFSVLTKFHWLTQITRITRISFCPGIAINPFMLHKTQKTFTIIYGTIHGNLCSINQHGVSFCFNVNNHKWSRK